MKSGKIMWNKVALLVGIVVGACVLCVALGIFLSPGLSSVFSRWLWKTNPEQAAATAHAMLSYELPPGYEERLVFEMSGGEAYAQASVVIVSTGQPGDLIMLEESTIEGMYSDPEWRGAVEERAGRQVGPHRYKVETVEVQDVVIKGAPNTLRITEGTDEEGRQVRQAITVVQGARGEVIIVIVAGLDTWDQAMVDAFLASIQ